ncbi:hypothetical protein HG536_0H04650 [Torulaspora globosa]|uniref:Uncharacterized protein n=1 Tax=Torulaspora globosa TaxID=48254 RepID=A0A7G3ZNK3_9SACH|nr:uncharacterized protein HG536_0H04650 [Torulaspora globosa]QLL35089.1 hypothetical protein HG536_0H04650 [Torulaspora globosa]
MVFLTIHIPRALKTSTITVQYGNATTLHIAHSMSGQLTAPYPPSIHDDISFQGPPSLRQGQQKPLGSLNDHSLNGIDGEYIEVIRSRPIPDGSRRYLQMNPVPNFSSNFNATKTAGRKTPSNSSHLPDPRDPTSVWMDVMLRSSLQRIKGPVEGTGSSALVRHKQTIIAVCILAVTWQLAILMDYLAQLVRYYCQT